MKSRFLNGKVSKRSVHGLLQVREHSASKKVLFVTVPTLAIIFFLFVFPTVFANLPEVAAISSPTAQNLNWQYYGNNQANTRFQDVDQINPSNVASLKVAWVFHTGVLDPLASFESSPIVVNGVMYITTGHDDLFALNASTGAQLWAYHPESQMPPLSQVTVCCGRDNRGVVYANGMVFMGRLDDVTVALNATTGQVIWQRTLANYQDKYAITMAPQYADGLVIVSLSGAEYQVRGQVFALNAETGQIVWRFYTTLPGHTWTGNSWKTGGATVWTTPAVDPRLGLVYVTTSNPSPDLNGVKRAGENLYSASIVALNIFTGQVQWYFQVTHHDLWDYDNTQAAALFNVRQNGQIIPALGACSKDGNYFILNRATGQPIFPVTEVPVPTTPKWQHPWPTQPMSSVQPLTPLTADYTPPNVTSAPEFTPPSQTPTMIVPGASGGCEFPPQAYSPRTGFVYYGARYAPVLFQTFPNNTQNFGSAITPSIPGVTDYGIFGATNTETGKVMWQIKIPQPAKAGASVAGNIVFFGEDDGIFLAMNALTGQILWSFNGPADVPNAGGANGAPSIYVVNGREYVAMAFGGNFLDRAFGINSPTGDALIVFALPQS